MEIILFIICSILLFLIVINYLRKLHLDAIHFNFLELTDVINGKVLRKGFLSRPVFHGHYKGIELTVNFSSERSEKKRRQYLNISFAKNLKNNLTISTENWIKSRNEASLSDFHVFDVEGDAQYVIRKPSKISYANKKRESDLKTCIRNLIPFNYIYIGQNGVLFERECENIATCTKHPQLRDIIESIANLTQVLK